MIVGQLTVIVHHKSSGMKSLSIGCRQKHLNLAFIQRVHEAIDAQTCCDGGVAYIKVDICKGLNSEM